jgi:putative CocE/NonD family hydrolase
VSLLSRAFGVQPHRTHAVRVQRDLVIPAGDGVPLLANRFYPADIDKPPLVLLRSPYGRGVALDRMPHLLAERGYQVLYQSLRGTGGSSGVFDGFTINPADGDGTLWWLREQPWFGGVLATWGASYLGFAQWELAARDIPEWKVAVIQDAPSEFAHQFMYPGGGFALGNALGWVQIVDRMFRARGGTARQFLGLLTGPRSMRHAVATLPVAEADIALTGRRVRWFQEWIHHSPDDPYWQATDHRGNVDRMPPVVYLQGGWYDFFLRGMLADYDALRAAGRSVRLLIGPWGHGRGLYTRTGMSDALAALDAALSGGTPRTGMRVFVTGSRRWITGSRRWIDLPGWPPLARETAWYLDPAGGLSTHSASAGPASWFRYDPANPTPSVGGTTVGFSAGPADNRRLEARPDVLCFTSDAQAADLEVIGPVRVRLYVQSSVAHIDLHARLCDVTPRGRSINISDGIVRLSDAASDTAQPIEFDLWPVAHAFLRGHRIRLQVSGGGHPRYGRNHGTAESFATTTHLQASDRTVLHDAQHPSAVWLAVNG